MWGDNKKTRLKKPISGLFKAVTFVKEKPKAVKLIKEKKPRKKRAISGKKKEVWEDFEKGYRPGELYGKYPDLQKRSIIMYFYHWKKMKWGKTDGIQKS